MLHTTKITEIKKIVRYDKSSSVPYALLILVKLQNASHLISCLRTMIVVRGSGDSRIRLLGPTSLKSMQPNKRLITFARYWRVRNQMSGK